MAKEPLKNHDNTEQKRTVLRASERVSSWPEWKRSATLYRYGAARTEGRYAEERDKGDSRHR